MQSQPSSPSPGVRDAVSLSSLGTAAERGSPGGDDRTADWRLGVLFGWGGCAGLLTVWFSPEEADLAGARRGGCLAGVGSVRRALPSARGRDFTRSGVLSGGVCGEVVVLKLR